MLQGELWSWLAEAPIALIAVAALLFLVLAWYTGRQQKQRRTQHMLIAVNDATFGRCVPRSRTGAWGFAVSIEPPPEHFGEFNISYQPVSIFDPFDLVRLWFGRRRTRLLITGVLANAPTAELIWARGQPPGRALGVNPGRAPWVYTRLDFAGAEYATRGTNVGAIKHALQDMYARFTPALVWVSVQREQRPQMRLIAHGKVDPRDLSPLITSARALGRAAMME
jgi:hypothetical protein